MQFIPTPRNILAMVSKEAKRCVFFLRPHLDMGNFLEEHSVVEEMN